MTRELAGAPARQAKRRNGVRAAAALALAAAAATAPAPGAGAASSLPTVESGHRPGPDALYEKPANPPQLRNAGPWRAEPIMVSGASAYRNGEFLYQDFIYDDHGAYGVADPTDPFNALEFLFAPKKGTLTYPTDGGFDNNGADLVELRVKPLRRSTAFRVTLNSLPDDPDRVGFTIALGTSATPVAWPHGAGVRSPAERFLTVHGNEAELRTLDGRTAKPAPRAWLAKRRRQFEVRVPNAAWDPGRRTVRMAAAVGLWNPEAGRYATPVAEAGPDNPGGGAASGSAIFNVAFRFDEPMPVVSDPPIGNTIVESGAAAKDQGSFWRERAQALKLAGGEITKFAARVDFGKLARRRTDNSNVPRRGFMNRILASHTGFGQGIDHERKCTLEFGDGCIPRFVGRLQPYMAYLPAGPVPRRGWGLTLLLHGLSANHNEFINTRHAHQFAKRDGGRSIVAAPLGRGPDGFWADLAEADVFEMWADIASRHRLDSRYTAVGGFSMGGLGTFRLTTRWPDLFAAGTPIVGTTTAVTEMTSALRNVPIMMWNVATDELVNAGLAAKARSDLAGTDVRYDSWMFLAGGHITLANNDHYGPMADFLGTRRAARNPAHATYVVNRALDSKRARARGDHAYWLSKIRPREGGQVGRLDVLSHAFGRGDPEPLPIRRGTGTLKGGTHGAMPYEFERREWGPAIRFKPSDRLTVEAKNVRSARIDTRRARVSCKVKLKVFTDGPLKLRLGGCEGRRAVRSFG